MVNSCCLCKISRGEIPGLSFFSIPANETQKKQWSTIVNRQLAKTSRICSRHFLPKDFQYKVLDQNKIVKYLLPNAVPTLLFDQVNDRINVSGDVTMTDNCQTTIGASVAIQAHEQTNQATSSARSFNTDHAVNNQLNVSIIKRNCDINNKPDKRPHETSRNLLENNCYNISNEPISIDSTTIRTSKFARLSGSESTYFKKKRYAGDLGPEDFTNTKAYEIVKKLYEDYRKKNKAYSQTTSRLKNKQTNLKDLIDHLKEAGFITKEGFDALKVSLD